jgi:NAD(P)-dependent dehydrogenase (short-subunit alcohol dehydrogenase family)
VGAAASDSPFALRAARDGTRVAIIAKTEEPHSNLEGTIYSAAEEIRAAGGQALPIAGDIRDDVHVQALRRSRDPRIVADAAHAILTRPSKQCTGRLFIDDEVLAEEGITDLSIYGGVDGELQTDLFLD